MATLSIKKNKPTQRVGFITTIAVPLRSWFVLFIVMNSSMTQAADFYTASAPTDETGSLFRITYISGGSVIFIIAVV